MPKDGCLDSERAEPEVSPGAGRPSCGVESETLLRSSMLEASKLRSQFHVNAVLP